MNEVIEVCVEDYKREVESLSNVSRQEEKRRRIPINGMPSFEGEQTSPNTTNIKE